MSAPWYSSRQKLDGYITVLAIISSFVLIFGLSDTINNSRTIMYAKPIPGRVVGLNDRRPYADPDRRDSFGLEYPVVAYVDNHGIKRSLMPSLGALPGYFHIGQEVKIGDGVILDRWYLWQEWVVLIPFFSLWILIAIGYYLYWRPRLISIEREEAANQSPHPTLAQGQR